MPKIYKYRIYCTTDNKWEYIWDTVAPTVCPVSGGHGVNNDSINEVEKTKLKTIDNSKSPYKAKKDFLKCDTSSGAITINLPKAEKRQDKTLYIQNISGTNNVTITPYGSELWDASNSSQTLTTDKQMVSVESDGTSWASQVIKLNLVKEDDIADEFLGDNGSLLVDTTNGMELLSLGTNGQNLVVDTSTDTGLAWKSTGDMIINCGGKDSAFMEISSSTDWTTAAAFVYRGSSVTGDITTIKFAAAINDSSDPATKNSDLRIYDTTNSLVIGTVTYTGNSSVQVVNLGTISNIPIGEAVLEIQGRKGSTGFPDNPRIYCCTIMSG